jgi:D-alanyl-D-alanine carboxypeptidase/D-alanyl-D-alanine-endopeptidase (penicillin-binding protein 4)
MNNKTMNITHHTSILAVALSVILTVATGCGSGDKKGTSKTPGRKAPTARVDTALQSRLKDFAQRPRVKGKFAFYVYDLTAQQPVYGYNERMSVPSASCLKLLTGVAGLHVMGTDYYYCTEILTHGTVKADTLQGDLVLRGSLDPQLADKEMGIFAKAIRRKGIRRVKGRVIMDLVITDPVKSEQHWYPWDLSFSKYGVFYKGSDKVKQSLRQALQMAGVSVADSQFVVGRVPRGSHCVFRYRRSIELVIRRMWKNSSNTQATSLLYTIGHRVNPKALPPVAGVQLLRSFLRDSLGMKDKNLVVHDGCGLCTYNRLSPLALATILRYGYNHPDIYAMLDRNLSVAGEDGTLRSEMADPKLRGKVKGKTGTLSHPYGISSLAGYCKTSQGHTLAFSIMDSEMSVLDARVLQKKLCQELIK